MSVCEAELQENSQKHSNYHYNVSKLCVTKKQTNKKKSDKISNTDYSRKIITVKVYNLHIMYNLIYFFNNIYKKYKYNVSLLLQAYNGM